MSEADGVKEDVLVVPPYELYCSILGVDKKKGIPILNELPAEFLLPEPIQRYAVVIDKETNARGREAMGFVDAVQSNRLDFRSSPIRFGGRNFSLNIEGLLRVTGGHKALAFLHGHLDRCTFSTEDLGMLKSMPDMAHIALVTYKGQVRALVQTKEGIGYPVFAPIIKLLSVIKSERIIENRREDDLRVAKAANELGFGYYVGSNLLSTPEVRMIRIPGSQNE